MELIQNLPENQCRTCLSIGRKLFHLGKYAKIYFKLLTNFNQEVQFPMAPVQVCWECHKLLHNISHFQNQVQEAEDLIKMGQNLINGTLSKLSTVIFNDVHVQNITLDYKDMNDLLDNKDMNDLLDNNNMFENDLSNDNEIGLKEDNDEQSLIDKDSLKHEESPIDEISLKDNDEKQLDLQIEPNIGSKIKKKRLRKWEATRAIEKKSKKFKIILLNNTMLDNSFKHSSMSPEEVSLYLKQKRDSKNYKLQRYKCESCTATFKKKIHFTKHRQTKHKESNKYTCDMCKEKYSNKDNLRKHIIQHCMKYSCNTCAFTSSNRRTILRHFKKIYECLKCQLKFCSKNAFDKHHKKWHEQYICDKCGKNYKMKHSIERHIGTHGPFICYKCNKQFSTYVKSVYHHKFHHRPVSKPVYCVECDVHFVDHNRYKLHLTYTLKHNPRLRNERYPCPDCDKAFKTKNYLKCHVNFVHLKQFNFRCEECDKNFIQKEKLMWHRQSVHEGVKPQKNKLCKICGRGFSTNRQVTHHIRTHTGERPHICSHCPAAFAQKVALRSHMRAVHSLKPSKPQELNQ